MTSPIWPVVGVVVAALIALAGVVYSARQSARAVREAAEAEERRDRERAHLAELQAAENKRAAEVAAEGTVYPLYQQAIRRIAELEEAARLADIRERRMEQRERRMEVRVNQLADALTAKGIEVPPWPPTPPEERGDT